MPWALHRAGSGLHRLVAASSKPPARVGVFRTRFRDLQSVCSRSFLTDICVAGAAHLEPLEGAIKAPGLLVCRQR